MSIDLRLKANIFFPLGSWFVNVFEVTKVKRNECTVVIRQLRKNHFLRLVCQNLTGMTYLQFVLATMLLHNLKLF
jgi:hypothetical protein